MTFNQAYNKFKTARADLKRIDELLKSEYVSGDFKALLRAERQRLLPGVESLRQKALKFM